MKAKELQKKIDEECEDLYSAAKRVFEQLERKRALGKLGDKSEDFISDKGMETILKQIQSVNKDVEEVTKEFVKEAEAFEKKVSGTTASGGKAPDSEKEKKSLEKAGDDLEDILQNYSVWIRAELIGPEMGEFEQEAATALSSFRKLEGELDKLLSEMLKRAAKISKPAEVVPSKFSVDYDRLCMVNKEEIDKTVREKLKRIDSNHEFDKVNTLCKNGIHEVDSLRKKIKATNKKFADALKELSKEIEKYDDHMFLLSRMK